MFTSNRYRMNTPISRITSTLSRLPIPCVLLVSVASLVPTSQAQADALADFSGGVGTASASTQFTGTAGEGWSTAWNTVETNTTITTNVLNSTPIFATDNYLSVNVDAGASASRRSALNRGLEDVNVSSGHTISFSLRPDSLTGFDATGDFLGIFSSASAVTGSTSSSSQTWGIIIDGSSKKIAFRDGENNGAAATGVSYIETGLNLTAGVTYDFTLSIDVENSQWQGTVTSSASESYVSETMSFRNTSGGLGNFTNFNTLMNSDSDDWTYSLNGLEVAAIPEPTTAGIMILLSSLIATSCLRRRK